MTTDMEKPCECGGLYTPAGMKIAHKIQCPHGVREQFEREFKAENPPKLSVVELRPKHACTDIVQSLRNLADDIEQEKYDYQPDMALVILGAESRTQVPDGFVDKFEWSSHGMGEMTFFQGQGLAATFLYQSEGGKE